MESLRHVWPDIPVDYVNIHMKETALVLISTGTERTKRLTTGRVMDYVMSDHRSIASLESLITPQINTFLLQNDNWSTEDYFQSGCSAYTTSSISLTGCMSARRFSEAVSSAEVGAASLKSNKVKSRRNGQILFGPTHLYISSNSSWFQEAWGANQKSPSSQSVSEMV